MSVIYDFILKSSSLLIDPITPGRNYVIPKSRAHEGDLRSIKGDVATVGKDLTVVVKRKLKSNG